jgi:hypothetical protein
MHRKHFGPLVDFCYDQLGELNGLEGPPTSSLYSHFNKSKIEMLGNMLKLGNFPPNSKSRVLLWNSSHVCQYGVGQMPTIKNCFLPEAGSK